jgi:dipeptide/tripeptide permease
MSTAVTPLSRRAAGACVAGAVLTVAGAVVTGIAISSTTVDDDLFGYPFEGAGATTFALAAAVAHLLVLVGLAGFRRSGAAGPGRAAEVGCLLAIAGTGLLFVAEFASIPVADQVESDGAAGAVGALFGLATIVLAAGLLTAGWTTLHAGRWQDWRRFTPLACGISVVVLIPVQLTSALWIGVGAYGLCFLALGIALAGRTEPAAVPVPA